MDVMPAGESLPVSGDVWRWISGLQANQEARRSRTHDAHAGCVPTPPSIAEVMAKRLLRGRSKDRSLRVLDAGCGTATLLTAVVREAAAKHISINASGIDLDVEAAQWAAGLEHLLRRATGKHLRCWDIRGADFLLDRCDESFDLIISNPPYVTLRSLPVPQRQKLQKVYHCGRGDLAVLFVNRMLDLLRPGGRLCVIVPNKLLATTYAEELRRRLLSHFQLREVHDLSRSNAFPGVGAYPVILIADRSERKSHIEVRDADAKRRSVLSPAAVRRLPGALLPLDFPPALIQLVNRLRLQGTLGDAVPLHCGIAVSGFGRAIGRGSERIIQSGDVRRFHLRPAKAFDPRAAGIDPKRLERQRVEKIVIPGMFQELCAARSKASELLGRVYYIPLGSPEGDDARHRAALLLALLNSRLYRVLYRGLFDAVAQAGGWLRLNGPYLSALPWPQATIPAKLITAAEDAERDDSASRAKRLDDLVDDLFGLRASERQACDLLASQHGWKVQRGGPEPSRQASPAAR